MDLPDSDQGDFSCRRAVDSSSFNRNSSFFIQENAFENIVCIKAAILSRPQCVSSLAPGRCGSTCIVIFTLTPPGWRGIVVTIRAGGRAAAKLAESKSL